MAGLDELRDIARDGCRFRLEGQKQAARVLNVHEPCLKRGRAHEALCGVRPDRRDSEHPLAFARGQPVGQRTTALLQCLVLDKLERLLDHVDELVNLAIVGLCHSFGGSATHIFQQHLVVGEKGARAALRILAARFEAKGAERAIVVEQKVGQRLASILAAWLLGLDHVGAGE